MRSASFNSFKKFNRVVFLRKKDFFSFFRVLYWILTFLEMGKKLLCDLIEFFVN